MNKAAHITKRRISIKPGKVVLLALLIPGNLGQVTAIGVGLVAGLLFCRGMAGGADHPLRV